MFDNLDWNIILPEIIRILPIFSLAIFLMIGAFAFRRRLENLLDNLTRLGAMGVEIEFKNSKEQLRYAFKSYSSAEFNIDDDKLEQIIARAESMRDKLKGSRILWVDDRPFANANIYRFLNDFEITVDTTHRSEDVIAALKWAPKAYEMIVSDMVRDENRRAGLDLLDQIEALRAELEQDKSRKFVERPVIIFVGNLDESLGTPRGARRITNKVDVLINDIFNIIEEQCRTLKPKA